MKTFALLGAAAITFFGLTAIQECSSSKAAPPPIEVRHLPPPPPPCIHEKCEERPRRLKCATSYTYYCADYEIIYEHHCVCDQWGPAQEK